MPFFSVYGHTDICFNPSLSRYGLANFLFMPSFFVYGPKTFHAKPHLTQSGLKCSFLPLSELPERLLQFISCIRELPIHYYILLQDFGIFR